VLARAREGDGDALVRAHAADVLESLEAWRMGRIAAAAREGGGREGGGLGLTSVRGLPDLQPRGPSGKIQVVEEA
jgi:Required for nuclear transport of RNA pol II C-terminus 2